MFQLKGKPHKRLKYFGPKKYGLVDTDDYLWIKNEQHRQKIVANKLSEYIEFDRKETRVFL